MRITLALAVLYSIAGSAAFGSDQTLPRGYVAYRSAGSIVVDGRLDEPAWKRVPWTEYHADIEGFHKPAPRFKTHSKIIWDDKYLYIGAELEEPHVWANLTKHDSVIFRDNDFEIFIDPDGDNRCYYEIEINALNTVWDLMLPKPYRDSGSAVDTFELPGMMHAVHVDGTINNPKDIDKGWSVEFAIPWSALGVIAGKPCPPRDGDQWRVNFSRVEWTTDISGWNYVKRKGLREDNWIWSPQGVVDMHRPEVWGFVQFSDARPGSAAFKRDPDQAARMYLISLYYAQLDYYRVKSRWASSIADLNLPSPDPRFAASTKIELTERGYNASVKSTKPGKSRWFIGQDSHLWQGD